MNSEHLNFEIRSVKGDEADPSRMVIRINEDCFENSKFEFQHSTSLGMRRNGHNYSTLQYVWAVLA